MPALIYSHFYPDVKYLGQRWKTFIEDMNRIRPCKCWYPAKSCLSWHSLRNTETKELGIKWTTAAL